jgi:hypothetical protein
MERQAPADQFDLNSLPEPVQGPPSRGTVPGFEQGGGMGPSEPLQRPFTPSEPQGPLDPAIEASHQPGPTTRSMYMKVAGNRFEVPSGEEQTFKDPELNAQYNRFLAQGDDIDKAQTKVIQMAREAGRDTRMTVAEGGRNTRQNAMLGFRGEHQLTGDQLEQNFQEGITAAEKRARIAANAKLGAAAISARGGGGPGELSKGAAAAFAAVHARARMVATDTAVAQLAKTNEAYDTLLSDVAAGTQNGVPVANPLQNREAQVLAAKIIRGRVTDAEMNTLYNNLGGAADFFNRLVHGTGLGELSPNQLGQLRQSVDAIVRAHHMQQDRAMSAARAGFGPTSGLPPDIAQGAMNEFSAAMGMPQEDIYPQDAGAAPAAAPARGAAPAGGGEHDSAVQWARAHKGDPRADRILKLHGLK